MRQIETSLITEKVAGLCMESNYFLCKDVKQALKLSAEKEVSPIGINVLNTLIENAEIAAEEGLPICQDTGMAIVFVEIGQGVEIKGGSLTGAINEGVRQGYKLGYLRNSIVEDPIRRKNTGDNTPAVIHYDIVMGGKLKITVSPKGFGSENMSALKMLKPSDGIEGVKNFVIHSVKTAGANPCPPIIVGVGVGGSMEKSALLAKKALLREIPNHNPDPFWADIETGLLGGINNLGIGPAGLGGTVTALAVNIEVFPTHIAGLPVSVNISCNATRHLEVIL
ncbi:MAG: fumarate hydratase [Clostridiales bacterium]|jgi:fumarate hydratase subunit alpha|nr:fumarate hydratase [Clostridiales bacterium]